MLAAAKTISSIKAVATIGAPFEPDHVTHLFQDGLSEIEKEGKATIKLAGRSFPIGKKFLEDLEEYNQRKVLQSLTGIASLIMHAPNDEIVPLKNAGQIYSSLPHPKSFIAIDGADHLLSNKKDSDYVAKLIKLWYGHLAE